MGPAYYNEIDQFCCRVLRKQIAAGNLPQGFVDERDIRDVRPDDLVGFRQFHLFAGIGGMPLGLRWAGMPDDFSICTFGFPCQDISLAGKGAGLAGERSGLFYEAMRIVRAVRPDWLLAENVPALRTRGADEVLDEMESAGYAARTVVVGAWAVGSPTLRDRAWIVAHPQGERMDAWMRTWRDASARANAACLLPSHWPARPIEVDSLPIEADGIPGRLAGSCIGNAVVPQVVEQIGRWIMHAAKGDATP